MIDAYRRTPPLTRFTAVAIAAMAALCFIASHAQALNQYYYHGGAVAPGTRIASPSASKHMVGNMALYQGGGQAEVCQVVTPASSSSVLLRTCGINGAGNALVSEILYGQWTRGWVENPASNGKTISILGRWYEDTHALWSGETLGPGAERRSRNGQYRLVMQHDGNLVLYNNTTGKACWHTNSNGHPGNVARLQTDGNFVVYGAGVPVGGTPYYFATGTWQAPHSQLRLANNGNLLMFHGASAIWQTYTGGCW